MRVANAIRPDRVAVYIRWSTEDQGEGTTLDVQRDACRHFLLSQGWQFRDDLVFVDEGYSGGTLNRPGLKRLRHLVKDRLIDCVVVYKLDRLSRSVVDTVKLILEEWEGRCYVKSAQEMVDTTNPMGRQVFYLLTSFAEWERSMIKERTFSGKLQRAREGKNPGYTAPFGYAVNDAGCFVVVPEQAEIVRRLFSEYLRHRSISELTRLMNGAGIPAPRGRGWGRSTIHRMLKNPAYIGRMVWGKQMLNPRRGPASAEPFRLKRDEPLVVQEAMIPAIVDPKVFDAVQRLFRERSPHLTPGRSLASAALLTGLATCQNCGHAITSYTRGPRKPGYYRCAGQSEKGKEYCPCGFIVHRVADGYVEDELLRLYADPRVAERVQAQMQNLLRAELRQAQAALHEVNRRMEALQSGLNRVDADYLAGQLSADRFEQLKSRLEAELREARQRADEWKSRIEMGLNDSARQQQFVHTLGEVHRWSRLERAEQKSLLRALVAKLTLFKDRSSGAVTIEIEWKVRVKGDPPAPSIVHGSVRPCRGGRQTVAAYSRAGRLAR